MSGEERAEGSSEREACAAPEERAGEEVTASAGGEEGSVALKGARVTKGSALVIREMRLEDIAPVFRLGEKLFSAGRWPNLYRTWEEYEVLSLYQGDRETCFVAEVGGELVGFALGSIIEKRKNAWLYGYLIWLGVSPGRQGGGVGKKLTRRIRERFIELGARMMLVDTDGENEEALRFFKRCGFGHERRHVYLSLNLTRDPDFERLRARGKREGR